MGKAVFCIARNDGHAVEIVNRLQAAGFPGASVSVLHPDRSGSHDVAVEAHTKAPEGAAAGAGTGGVLGGAVGWLVGLGMLAIPGLGPVVAAGPLLAALSGAAVGAATGGFAGALIGLGIPEFEAKRYAGKIGEGHVLVSVHTTDAEDVTVAKAVFSKSGAESVTTAGEVKVAQ